MFASCMLPRVNGVLFLQSADIHVGKRDVVAYRRTGTSAPSV